MLSALKKLTAKQDAVAAPPDTAGHPMSGSLQKKFSRGVHYNMKIIIKGDRNVGKSCLLQRLQGGGFIEAYTPTEQIQVASIQWSFKATEDIVKVEVWDVVDRGKARPRTIGLKLTTLNSGNNTLLPECTPALDAEFLDVYKGTHGVILMMDVTKSWTFDYVTRELPKVPSEIPVLILGNHCDMSHHRVISTGQATALIETFGENRPAEILYAESSMRNGFGLRLLHKFLGLPFLRLQKETLLALIERNKRDTEICGFEIAEFLKSDDADYNQFLSNLSNKRRQIAESNSRVPPPSSSSSSSLSAASAAVAPSTSSLPHSASTSSISSHKPSSINTSGCGGGSSSAAFSRPHIQSTQQELLRPTKSIIVGGGQPIIIPGQVNITQQLKQQQLYNQQKQQNGGGATGTASSTASNIPQKDIVTTLLHKSCDMKNSKLSNSTVGGKSHVDEHNRIASVEEFCPDEGILDKSFLDDITNSINHHGNQSAAAATIHDDSDSDDAGGGNPMVARFDDEPDDDDDDDNDDDDIVANHFVNNSTTSCSSNISALRNLTIGSENSAHSNSNNNSSAKGRNKNSNSSASSSSSSSSVKQIKINPLAKHNRKSNDLLSAQATGSEITAENIFLSSTRKYSISSEEISVVVPSTPPLSSSLVIAGAGGETAAAAAAAAATANNAIATTTSATASYHESSSTPPYYDENSDNNWLPETSVRRSPEGGEDISSIISTNNNRHHDSMISMKTTVIDASGGDDDVADGSGGGGKRSSSEKKSKHKKKKDKKDKDEKRSSNEKKKKKHHHSSSSTKRCTDLEEFLNGTTPDDDISSRHIEEAYEAI